MNAKKIVRDYREKVSVRTGISDFLHNETAKERNSLLPDEATVRRMQSLYGENRPVTGEYDPSLSAVCENGVFIGKDIDHVLTFKGIPFAKPPVGERRWKLPEKPDPCGDVREAYYFGCSPIQSASFSERASSYIQSEDCLYLNVWTGNDRLPGKPVMVFIHGGSYGWGGTSDPLYEGHNLVSENPDIVLVTIAYRTGIMGFMDFSSVPGGEKYYEACNLGLFDQIRALEWVRDNISAFGGDPENVTVFGESAGGGSVSLLPLMEQSRDLFKRVIAESGSVALTFSKEECQLLTKKLLKYTRCKSMQELCALPEETLKKVNDKLNEYNNFPMRDGQILPLDPYRAYKEGKAAHVDMLIGTNKDECRYWIRELGGEKKYRFAAPILFENNLRMISQEDEGFVHAFMHKQESMYTWAITEFYNEVLFRVPALRQAEYQAANGAKVFNYYWTSPSAIGSLGACHAVELAYVFNNLDDRIYTGDYMDEALAKRVQRMWINFAKTGNPSTETFTWDPYSKDARCTAVLGREDRMETDLLEEQRKLITPLLKYRFNGSYASMSLRVPYLENMLIGIILALLLIGGTITALIILL